MSSFPNVTHDACSGHIYMPWNILFRSFRHRTCTTAWSVCWFDLFVDLEIEKSFVTYKDHEAYLFHDFTWRTINLQSDKTQPSSKWEHLLAPYFRDWLTKGKVLSKYIRAKQVYQVDTECTSPERQEAWQQWEFRSPTAFPSPAQWNWNKCRPVAVVEDTMVEIIIWLLAKLLDLRKVALPKYHRPIARNIYIIYIFKWHLDRLVWEILIFSSLWNNPESNLYFYLQPLGSNCDIVSGKEGKTWCKFRDVTSFLSLLPLVKLGQTRAAEAAMQAVPSTGPKICMWKRQIPSTKNKLRRNLILKGQRYSWKAQAMPLYQNVTTLTLMT